nr:uncharacterized protein LOC132763824 [Anolis sagrei ordinatus]
MDTYQEELHGVFLPGKNGVGIDDLLGAVFLRLVIELIQTIVRKACPEAAAEMDTGDVWTLLKEPSRIHESIVLLGRAFSTCSEDLFLDGLLQRFLPPLNKPSGIFRDLSLAFCVELTEHLMVHKPEVRTPLLQSWLHEAKEGEPMPRAMAIRGLRNTANAMATSKVRTDPKLLESLLAELPHYLSSLLEEVQLEACKLAGVLLENMDTLCCETLDLEPLSQGTLAASGRRERWNGERKQMAICQEGSPSKP